MKLVLIAIAIGTLIPVLTVTQFIVQKDLLNADYWLGLAALAIASFSSSTLAMLTYLAARNGFPVWASPIQQVTAAERPSGPPMPTRVLPADYADGGKP